jgi:hypothetical protein
MIETHAAFKLQYTIMYLQPISVKATGVTSAARKLKSYDTAVDIPQICTRCLVWLSERIAGKGFHFDYSTAKSK